MERVIYFDITTCINETALCDWICSRIAKRNIELKNKVALLHSEEITNIKDYIFDLYENKFINPYTLGLAFDDALKTFGYTLEQLTSDEVIKKPLANIMGL